MRVKSMPIRSKLMFGLIAFSIIPVIAFGWLVCNELDRVRQFTTNQIQLVGLKSVEEVRDLTQEAARQEAEQMARKIAALLAQQPDMGVAEVERQVAVRGILNDRVAGRTVTVQLLRGDTAVGAFRVGAPDNGRVEAFRGQDAAAPGPAPAEISPGSPRLTSRAAVPGSPLKILVTLSDLKLDKPVDRLARSIQELGTETEMRAFDLVDTAKLMLVLGVAGLVVGLTLLAGVAAGAITKPIEKITAAAEQISRGETEVNLDVRGGREIQLLAGAFRRATSELQTYNHLLQDKNAELDSAYTEMKRLASEDSLTSTRTRRTFDELLRNEWQRACRYGSSFCVALIDIDRLKSINDQHGHAAGDEAIQAIAFAVMVCCRQSDAVARYGGDEFAVLLPQTALAGASSLFARIQDAVAAARLSFADKPASISVGIASSAGKRSLDELLARTDEALYEAKRAGRARTCTEEDVTQHAAAGIS